MTFDYALLADPRCYGESRLPAHSDHRWYAGPAEAMGGGSSYEQSLNGLWHFHFARNLAQLPAGFEQPDYDCRDWDSIQVPGHIQLQGYDRPQYVNVQYPWDGLEQIGPGEIPQHHNPVGSYVRYFQHEPLAEGERLSVCFHGAESAIAVWLNGHYIGYSTDSFTPAEFDLTGQLVVGQNKLAAQVFRYSAGSWIEDQDFYRFSGLFRDVVLYRRPRIHVEDLELTWELAADFSWAEVRLKLALSGPGRASAAIAGVGEMAQGEPGAFVARIEQPRLWSDEQPELYQLAVELRDETGALLEHIPQTFGLRRFGIEDGLLKLNGRRIVFRGVNRHEFGLQGRVMTRQQTEADIRALKAAGVNALRTSHYPNNSFLYELCDRYGLMVIDEMNLESHGLWDKLMRQQLPLDQAVPGDRPEWLPALLDRAASMVERDKNHPSIVIWSCGNESFGGSDLLAVSDYFRDRDPSRVVHYEGVHWDPRYRQTSDIESQMYTPAAEVEAYLKTHRDKPFIMCEYAHAMGNSCGAVDKYVELAYRDPLFQGGFVWDFADQAILLRDRYGEPYFGYGGDCGDAPNDLDFCGNGIFFADHTPSPKLAAIKRLYQGFVISVSPAEVTITNRLLWTDSSAYQCLVTLNCLGKVLASQELATAVAPGETVSYPLPLARPTVAGEYTIDVSLRLRQERAWAPAGYEVAWGQGVVTVEPAQPVTPARHGGSGLELIRGTSNFGVRGEHFTALFARSGRGFTSYRYGLTGAGGRELLRSAPLPNFWHAPTANERGWGMPHRDGQWLLASLYPVLQPGQEPTAEAGPDAVTIRYQYLLPTVPASQCQLVYEVYAGGQIGITAEVTPGAGLPDMPEFGVMFKVDADLHNLQWYGEGPDEAYVDRRQGARLGVYQGDVMTELTPYLRPQEAGSHTGVRWAEVTDDHGRGLRLTAEEPMEFSALPYTPVQIEQAAHHHELPRPHYTVLRPAWLRRGVGGDQSWGAQTHPEYCLPRDQVLSFRFTIQGIG